MKKIVIVLSVCSLLLGCKNDKKQTETKDQTAERIKMYALDGGQVLVNKLELFSQDTTYTGQTRAFADAYYVIKHPKGTLMWDAGLPENLVGQEPFTDPSGAFTVSRRDSLAQQLNAINMSIDSIDYIALSHSHFDHTGHANSLKNATWLVQESEYNFVTNDSAKVKDPNTYNSIKELKNVKTLNGDHDVFGDGTVVIKSMPGHTIGHQVLFVDLGDEQPYLLSGDLYHLEENRTNRGVPIFNYNVEQTLESMAAFEDFAKEKNALVFIQHSKEDFEKLTELLAKN